MRPRINVTIKAGTSVTARIAAEAIAKVFVKASGRNIRPSTCSSVNTGRKLTVTMRSEKNRLGPTSLAAWMMADCRVSIGGSPSLSATSFPPFSLSPILPFSLSPIPSRSKCLCAFSTMTRLASTMTPMAMAIPPSDMMLALMPSSFMMRSEARMPTGTVTRATKALRTWRRKTITMRATTSSSSQICVVSVPTARLMRAERSYSVTTSTPSGRPAPSSASRAFTRSMVFCAFSP